MKRGSRTALVFGCDRFDSSALQSLNQAEKDARDVREFIEKHGDMEAENITFLPGATSASFKKAFIDAARVAGASQDGCLFLYCASHAVVGADGTLFIFAKDTDPENKSLTAISTSFIVETLIERKVPASITVLDVCYAESHLGGLTRVVSAHRKLIEQGVEIDGHFLLAACSPGETSKEGQFGGRFTQALLGTLDSIGRSNPRLELLPAHLVASAVTDAAATLGLKQTPRWSGLSIGRTVSFSKNPHFDREAPGGYPPVSLHSFTSGDRDRLREPVAGLFAATSKIGTGLEWAADAAGAVIEAAKQNDLSVASETIAVFVERSVEQVFDRLGRTPADPDLEDALLFAERCLVELGRIDQLGSSALPQLSYRLTDIAGAWLSYIEKKALHTNDTWFMEFGYAALGIAPVYLTDTLGKLALLAQAALLMSKADVAEAFSSLAEKILTRNEKLWRLSFTGQLPDVAASMRLLLPRVPDLVKARVQSMMDFRLDAMSAIRQPLASFEDADDLGRSLCRRYLDQTCDRYDGDESIAALLVLAHVCGIQGLSADALVGRVLNSKCGDETILYIPREAPAQYQELMKDCAVHSWPLSHTDSMAKLLVEIPNLISQTAPFVEDRRSRLASLTAARMFRNRSAFWIAAP